AQNGVAGEHRDITQLARHRLHHDFLGVEDAVHDDTEAFAADLSNHDEPALDVGGVGLRAEYLAQARQWQQLVAQPQQRGVLDAFDPVLAAGARAYQFDYRNLWDGETVTAGLHDQRRDDRQRERDLDREADPGAR